MRRGSGPPPEVKRGASRGEGGLGWNADGSNERGSGMSIATIESMDTRRFPRWAIWVTVIVLMLLTLYGAWRIGLKRAIARELDAMKAAGYPTTFAELDAWYAYPPAGSENAALKITSALGRMRSPEAVFGKREVDAQPWLDANLIDKTQLVTVTPPYLHPCAELVPTLRAIYEVPPSQEFPASCIQLSGEYLEANRAVMDELVIAAQNPTARYPIDLKRGEKMLLPHLSQLGQARLLFALREIEAESGQDSVRAEEAVVVQAGLARSLEKEPVLVSQLVRIVCQQSAVTTLERAMNHMAFSSDQIRRLQGTMAQMECPAAMQYAMVGEAVDSHSLYEVGAVQEMLPPFRRSLDAFLGIVDYSDLRRLQFMRQYITVTTLADPVQLAAATKLDAAIEAAKSQFWTRDILGFYSSRALEIRLRTLAMIRNSQGALAAQRWRLEHGAWPVSWAELVLGYLDAEPVDPFTGKALMIKVEGDVLTVYSVGHDLTDNGGARVNGAGKAFEAGADVVFVIRAPKVNDPR